jgi:hypothetical protein
MLCKMMLVESFRTHLLCPGSRILEPFSITRGSTDPTFQFNDYTENITPHLLSYPDPPTKYMRTLLRRLYNFNLTKAEVLVMINLGIGVKKTTNSGANAMETGSGEAVEKIENSGGDLLDKVERHINSAQTHDGMQSSNDHTTNEDIQMQDGQEGDPDITVLNTVIEEMYERFNDADINEILKICGQVLGDDETSKEEADIGNGLNG